MVHFPVSKWAAHSKQGKSAKIIFADRDDDEQRMVFMITLDLVIITKMIMIKQLSPAKVGLPYGISGHKQGSQKQEARIGR